MTSPLRVGQHLAMLGGNQFGDFGGMLFDQVAKLEHHAGAGEGRGRGPFRKRGGGSPHGSINLVRAAQANFSRELPGGGIEDVAEFAAMRRDCRAGDKMRDGIHVPFSRETWGTASAISAKKS